MASDEMQPADQPKDGDQEGREAEDSVNDQDSDACQDANKAGCFRDDIVFSERQARHEPLELLVDTSSEAWDAYQEAVSNHMPDEDVRKWAVKKGGKIVSDTKAARSFIEKFEKDDLEGIPSVDGVTKSSVNGVFYNKQGYWKAQWTESGIKQQAYFSISLHHDKA